jgi:hypothetical protein
LTEYKQLLLHFSSNSDKHLTYFFYRSLCLLQMENHYKCFLCNKCHLLIKVCSLYVVDTIGMTQQNDKMCSTQFAHWQVSGREVLLEDEETNLTIRKRPYLARDATFLGPSFGLCSTSSPVVRYMKSKDISSTSF